MAGVIAWCALAWALLLAPWRCVRGDPGRRGWAVALTAYTVVGLVHSSYEPTFPGVQYCFLFFWVYAVLYRGLEAGGTERPAGGALESAA